MASAAATVTRTSMRVFRTQKSYSAFRRSLAPGKTVGFVPTMGGLHDGHLALIREAQRTTDFTVVSLFVNPSQFSGREDFYQYPADENTDMQKCMAEGVDAVFSPDAKDVYPPGFQCWMVTEVGSASRNRAAEGALRPFFFRGVATIVLKLVHLIQPDKMFCGQKDAQQCAVLRSLFLDMWIEAELVVVPTVREHDGLALSSRNAYLSPAERTRAPVLYEGLLKAQQAVNDGERNPITIRKVVEAYLAQEADKMGDARFVVDYVSVCDQNSMEEFQTRLEPDANVVVCTAATLGKARLIDNIVLDIPSRRTNHSNGATVYSMGTNASHVNGTQANGTHLNGNHVNGCNGIASPESQNRCDEIVQ